MNEREIRRKARRVAKELAEKNYKKSTEQEARVVKAITEQVAGERKDSNPRSTLVRRHILIGLIAGKYGKGDKLPAASKFGNLIGVAPTPTINECMHHLTLRGVTQRATSGRSYEMKSISTAKRELKKEIDALNAELKLIKKVL